LRECQDKERNDSDAQGESARAGCNFGQASSALIEKLRAFELRDNRERHIEYDAIREQIQLAALIGGMRSPVKPVPSSPIPPKESIASNIVRNITTY